MKHKPQHITIISDFNAGPLIGFLNNNPSSPQLIADSSEYGQVIPTLIKHASTLKESDDVFLIWTKAECIIEAFTRMLQYNETSLKEIIKELDAYCDVLLKVSKQVKCILLPTWVMPPSHSGSGLQDMQNGFGVSNTLMRMNLHLCDRLNVISNVYILNTHSWIGNSGLNAFDNKLWYRSKIPFNIGVFKNAANDIKASINTIYGNSRKLIIVDLDDTLWGDTIGDVGIENICLGGHDANGEAFVEFQEALKGLSRRGVLLGIVSKNDESIACEAINKHPEMKLRLSDFSGYRINWEDKAKNIVGLASDLNLGLDSIVFIDDSEYERSRIREALPEVLVPEWPKDKSLYTQTLHQLRCFDSVQISSEDKQRAWMYTIENERQSTKHKFSSIDDWIKTLGIQVFVEKYNQSNSLRALQLLNKTNQMNLSTRRMTEAELNDWLDNATRTLWTFRVKDKFGDYGIVGIMSIEIQDIYVKIIDFVLSCRIFGRDIEKVMLHIANKHAISLKLQTIQAQYIKTNKNKPCLNFLKMSGFLAQELNNNIFETKLRNDFLKPNVIQIIEHDTNE